MVWQAKIKSHLKRTRPPHTSTKKVRKTKQNKLEMSIKLYGRKTRANPNAYGIAWKLFITLTVKIICRYIIAAQLKHIQVCTSLYLHWCYIKMSKHKESIFLQLQLAAATFEYMILHHTVCALDFAIYSFIYHQIAIESVVYKMQVALNPSSFKSDYHILNLQQYDGRFHQ